MSLFRGGVLQALSLVSLFLYINTSVAQNNVGIGTTTPDPSALLELDATDKGFLIPRLTTAQRLAITAPANSLLVFDTTLDCFFYYSTAAGSWISLCTPGPSGSSLSSLHTVSSGTYTNVPLTVTFTATSATANVFFSASGEGDTLSVAYVRFRIVNNTNSTNVGTTQQHMQEHDPLAGTLTHWSCNYSGLLTGLVPGTVYTIQVQALTGGISGTYDATIDPSVDGHHMTLTVIP